MDDLAQLAELIKTRNWVEAYISTLVGGSTQMAHVGAFIASRVFRIAARDSASRRTIGGHFVQGPLAGRSVNVRWHPRPGGMLDISPDALPDFYLVLAGPESPPASREGAPRPWLIASVHHFDGLALVDELRGRTTRITPANSVPQDLWEAAEVYPAPCTSILLLSDAQRKMLVPFG